MSKQLSPLFHEGSALRKSDGLNILYFRSKLKERPAANPKVLDERHRAVNAILSGNEEIDINELANACRHERLTQSSRHKIGF